jgi:diacylglycerol O-acyltransferase / wax synthase
VTPGGADVADDPAPAAPTTPTDPIAPTDPTARTARTAQTVASDPAAAIERVGPDDLTYLATGPSSSNLGVVLELAGPAPPLEVLREVLAPRVAAIPRLRQRIRRVPRGGGRPIWVDDAAFDLRRHVVAQAHAGEVDGAALASLAATLVGQRLPLTRPLWSLTLVTGRDPTGPAGLIVVVHHVLTDGIGGLAVLAALADDGAGAAARPFPRPVPSLATLRADARRRWQPRPGRLRAAAATVRAGWRELLPSGDGGAVAGDVPATVGPTTATAGPTAAAAATRRSRVRSLARATAPRCALNAPTGPRRAAAIARVPLAEVRTLGRTVGATVNDVVLAAITGALGAYLAEHADPPDHLVASVPVSRREQTGAGELGNAAGVMPVVLPVAEPDPVARLRRIAAETRGHRGSQRGASLALLRPVFRALTTLGLWGWMVDRQRMVNVLVSNVRGPREQLRMGGRTITGLVPLGTPAGNVAVSFTALSYAGELTITVVVDPDVVPDPAPIAAGLERELARLGERLAPAADGSAQGHASGT